MLYNKFLLSVVSYDIYRRGRKKTFAYQFGKGQVLIVKSKESNQYFSIYPGAYAKYTGTCILGMSPETFEINLGVGAIIKNF